MLNIVNGSVYYLRNTDTGNYIGTAPGSSVIITGGKINSPYFQWRFTFRNPTYYITNVGALHLLGFRVDPITGHPDSSTAALERRPSYSSWKLEENKFLSAGLRYLQDQNGLRMVSPGSDMSFKNKYPGTSWSAEITTLPLNPPPNVPRAPGSTVLDIVSGSIYYLRNVGTGNYLGNAPGSTTIILGGKSNSPYLQWKFTIFGSAAYYIMNVGTGLYVQWSNDYPGLGMSDTGDVFKLGEDGLIQTIAMTYLQDKAGFAIRTLIPGDPTYSWSAEDITPRPPNPPIVPTGPIPPPPLALSNIGIAASIKRAIQPPVDGLYFIVHRGVYSTIVSSSRKRLPVPVAIKAVRPPIAPGTTPQQQQDFETLLNQRIMQWQGLTHDHVVPLLGVTMGYGPFPAMITPWMSNGTVTDYLAANPYLSVADRMKLINDVAKGVEYLHSQTIVHSDLRASSVLVDDFGDASLADPGMLSLFANSPLTINGQPSDTSRWKAPELLRSPPSNNTQETDIYAFTMTSLEIYTGQPPLVSYNDGQISAFVIGGGKPSLPPGLQPALGTLWNKGWDDNPRLRPPMTTYVTDLQAIP